VALVDAGTIDAVATQSADDHLGVLVAGEDGRGTDDGPVHVSSVVEDCAATASSADEIDGSVEAGFWEGDAAFSGGGGIEEGEVHFQPGVLVAAYDDAGSVRVEEENGGICG